MKRNYPVGNREGKMGERQLAEFSATEVEMEELLERDWNEVEVLVLYLDGMPLGSHHVLSAVGVDAEGHKHVLGMVEGASENQAAAQALHVHLREHWWGSRNAIYS